MKGNVVGRVGLPQWFKDQQVAERRKFHADQVARMAAFNEWQQRERDEMMGQLRDTVFPTSRPSLGYNDSEERAFRRTEIALAYLNSADTMETVGEQFGISRERVRQCVALYDPDKKLTEKRRVRIENDRLIAQLQERVATAKPCIVCENWVLRDPYYKTCSPECAAAWKVGRFRLDPEEKQKHRLSMARTYLASPEKYKPAHLDWAERILSNNPPAQNRTYSYPNSEATRLLKKVGKA